MCDNKSYVFEEEYRGFNIHKSQWGFYSIGMPDEPSTYSALYLVSIEVARKCIDVYLNSINYQLNKAYKLYENER
jgi:hypothetical protein